MPTMAGFEVLEKRKGLDYFKDIPVVVITSSGAVEDQIKAFELGASDYINNPFVPEIAVSRVDNVVASHRRMLSMEQEARKFKVRSELDQMTGLYNKSTSQNMINEILKTGEGKINALFVIDIDNFKSVNDISGHLEGDHVIRIVADLISSLFRKSDVVGRIGGDEFVALMVDVPSMELVRSKVNELIQIMKYKPNLTIPENVALSIGVADNKKQITNYDELFQRADQALYEAKQSGKARYREYGVEPLNLENDHRPVALLISRNRSVCSIVHAHIPEGIRVIEALELEELNYLKESDVKKLELVYADVSDYYDAAEEFWEKVASYDWMNFSKCMGICNEGDMAQYKAAINRGVADILTTPLDVGAFKRRTFRHMQKLHVDEGRKL
jgi:diguanylate cyclase (GGDEF)-like protein